MLLVGDNPFHGISHLSQERSRARGNRICRVEHAAELVKISLENGANGFMFSVSETTLSILKTLRQEGRTNNLKLYAIVPYAYEYVRQTTQAGGISALGKKIAKQIVLSANVKAVAMGLKGLIRMDLVAFLKAYLIYEVSRIKSAAGRHVFLDSVLLHEIITEMALALDLEWLFTSFIEFMLRSGIKPGFETRNFCCLVNKFSEWGIDFGDVIIATPFNKIGFQMNPSKIDCENALISLSNFNVIAMSVLAAGSIKPLEAINYIKNLPNLKGVVVGVSKEQHARETFQILNSEFQ